MKRTPLIAKRPVDHRSEPGYREWHAPSWGPCPLCGQYGLLLRHHVMRKQDVRIAKGDPWDLRNSFWIGAYCEERCHRRHHAAFARIPASEIPAPALEFIVELYGEDRGEDYVARHYLAG